MAVIKCRGLTKVLYQKVSYSNSVAYNTSLQSYWSQQEEQVRPHCIVVPTNSQDVSTAVKTLTDRTLLGATTKTRAVCKFAVRSGGHTAHAGSANIADGVTIDLRALNEITLSKNNTLVIVGPGQRWENVYRALEPLGLGVPGGRVDKVGVGGLLLGGGISYFPSRVGFSCDNVAYYEIVLANGSIINVSSRSHYDLWLALKGGSNNFGIVTRFVLHTFEQGSIWAGNIVSPLTTVTRQLDAFSAFVSASDFDENAGLIQNFAFDGSQGYLVNQPFYALPIVNPPAFQPFVAIQPQLASTMAVTSLAPFSVVYGAVSPSELFQLTFATTFQNNLTMLRTLFDLWNASISDVATVNGISWAISIQPLNKAVMSKSALLGGNSLGLPLNPPSGSLVLVLLSATWVDKNQSLLMNQAADKLLNNIIHAAKTSGTFNRYIDLNHANKNQDPISGYGPDVKAKLQAVSREYDPDGVFQTAVPGGFKLFV